MDKAVSEVEFEQMLMSRHGLLSRRRGRRANGVLERSAYVLLSRIRVQGPMSIGELSEAFDLDVSTVQRQTTAATRDGLLDRFADPGGGMARKFGITEQGASLLDEERLGVTRSLGRIMADWPGADVSAFAQYLRRFNTDLERLDGRPWPRPRAATLVARVPTTGPAAWSTPGGSPKPNGAELRSDPDQPEEQPDQHKAVEQRSGFEQPAAGAVQQNPDATPNTKRRQTG